MPELLRVWVILLLGLCGTAQAFGPASQVDVAEIVLDQGTTSRPEAWTRLLFELIQSTSVVANPRAVQLAPEDPTLFEHPFSVMVGTGAFPPLSEAAIAQLRRYLSYGGFLLLDDSTAIAGGGFEASARRLAQRIFPTRPLAPLASEHSIYRAFFLIGRPQGRVARAGVVEGVTVGPVTPLVYFADDLSGALDRGPDGRDRQAVIPGGEVQRREAIKLGINLIMYSLTSNYKHDTAHVLELMREGRIE